MEPATIAATMTVAAIAMTARDTGTVTATGGIDPPFAPLPTPSHKAGQGFVEPSLPFLAHPTELGRIVRRSGVAGS
jgi:hypothetical protein